MTATIGAAYAALFVACAVSDILTLRIPNMLVAALALLFAAACLMEPPQSLLWQHLAPAGAVFALTAVLFFLGQFGAGDVKLLSVAVLWVGAPQLGAYLIALALFGLASIFVFSVYRTQVAAMLQWAGARIGRPFETPLSLRTGKSIPYGVVIAAAALTAAPEAFWR